MYYADVLYCGKEKKILQTLDTKKTENWTLNTPKAERDISLGMPKSGLVSNYLLWLYFIYERHYESIHW